MYHHHDMYTRNTEMIVNMYRILQFHLTVFARAYQYQPMRRDRWVPRSLVGRKVGLENIFTVS